ncbi:MAG: glycosyltransferase [Betaproteobacteria bacterium]|nr:glycosyltransferase [Betaproteobacteria bacterium]
MALTFSIITCTWNSEPYIKDSIESVLAQDYPHIEYIFVDGGSTDGTVERIQAIPRPYKFVTGVRGGITRAMNQGLSMATGDVVAHLHSDDFYLHHRVLSEVADLFGRTGCGWAFGRNMFMHHGKLQEEGWAVPKYSYRALLKNNFIPHEATFVRKELFDRMGGFSPDYKYAMDYEMWLRLGRIAEPQQIDSHLAAFRVHEKSLSSAVDRYTSLNENFRIRMKYLGGNPLDLGYFGARYAYHLWQEWRKGAKNLVEQGG